MKYVYEGKTYELNLIDTPGHIDFSYEVSRAIQAVEGTLLLVDSTQRCPSSNTNYTGNGAKFRVSNYSGND